MKKKIWMIVLALLTIAMIAGFVLYRQDQRDHYALSKKNGSYWLLSDVHFLDPKLHDDGSEFQFIKKTAAGKDLDYQVESLQAFVDKAIAEKPSGIIITGDLTLNGEKQSAKKMAQLFKPLKEKQIALYCIPGNHDIYDGWARNYHGDQKQKIPQLSPEDFKNYFPDGYQDSYSSDDKSISYAVSINSDYQFIFLDSNIYTIEPSTSAPVTAGELQPQTIRWLKEVLETGKRKKQTSLVFLHHNLLKHNPLLYKGYLLNNADSVKALLNDYQVPLAFSGHIHVQDIMKDRSQTDGLTEIVSSSFAIADHGYGVLNLSQKQLSYQRKTLNVDAWAKSKGKSDKNLLQHRRYLTDLFINDGEAMAYRQLLEKQLYDEAILDPIAAFIGQANYDYFTGQETTDKKTADEIKTSHPYRLIEKYSHFLRQYSDTIIYDNNLNDQKLVIKR